MPFSESPQLYTLRAYKRHRFPRRQISAVVNGSITLTYNAGPNGILFHEGPNPQTVNYGEDGSPVRAIPNSGYSFYRWSDDSTENPRTDENVTSHIAVTAYFAETQALRTLTYSAKPNGFISGINPQYVIVGQDGLPVTARPFHGYSFREWSDGSTENPRTDENVMADITVTASFNMIP